MRQLDPRCLLTRLLLGLSLKEFVTCFQSVRQRRIVESNYFVNQISIPTNSPDFHEAIITHRKVLSFAVPSRKDLSRRSFKDVLYHNIKWFATLVRHIVELIVRSIRGFDDKSNSKKDNSRGRSLERFVDEEEEVTVQSRASVVVEEQTKMKPPSRIGSLPTYKNHERKEADKSYAERKLQEIENLQAETQNMRIMKRAQAEKDGRWAQDTLDKNEKIIIAGGSGGIKSDNTNIAQNVKEVEETTSKFKTSFSDSDGDGDGDDVSSTVRNTVENRKNILYTEKELVNLADRNQGTAAAAATAATSQASEGSVISQKGAVRAEPINEESRKANNEKGERSSGSNSSKFSSKPNLNVILKRSLKDSLYSINMNGYYSNNETPQNDEKIKNSEMNPLVRNSLLLSEKVEFEKKINADKNMDTSLPIPSSTNMASVEDGTTVEMSNSAEIKDSVGGTVWNVGSGAPVTASEAMLIHGSSSDDNASSATVSTEPHTEDSTATSSELEKAAVTVPSLDFSTEEVQQGTSTDEENRDVVSVARESIFKGVDESTRRALTAGAGAVSVESMKAVEPAPAAAIASPALGQDLPPAQAQAIELSSDSEDGYGEGSVERLVQAQQAEEYANSFSDSSPPPPLPSSAGPSNPPTDHSPSMSASPLTSFFPSSSSSSPSSSSSSSSVSSVFSNPPTVPFCLLGDWDLAEQRYLTTDRSALSEYYLDVISVPSFGSLSSSLSGSKGMEWAARKRIRGSRSRGSERRDEERERDVYMEGVQGEGGTWAQEVVIRKAKSKSTDESEGTVLTGQKEDYVTIDIENPGFEEYDVEFSVIRGCSSTEWMKGLGREETTITARIIKPPKEATEQRPTLCTYEGVLTSMTSIKGYVFSTPVTVEGEKQLVGEFEMKKVE